MLESTAGSTESATGRQLPWVAGLLLTAADGVSTDRIGDAVEQVVGADRELLEHLALRPTA